MIYIGIDPGLSGGIGLVTQSGEANAYKMPETDHDIAELFRDLIRPWPGKPNPEVFAMLEKVWGFPGGTKRIRCPKCGDFQTIKQAQGIASTSKFMTNYGTLRGILTALKIPYELVTPITWQKGVQIQMKGDKNVSKAKAQRLFPDLKITHATADALLIAEYCRRWKEF